jgi:hypothetical protein
MELIEISEAQILHVLAPLCNLDLKRMLLMMIVGHECIWEIAWEGISGKKEVERE